MHNICENPCTSLMATESSTLYYIAVSICLILITTYFHGRDDGDDQASKWHVYVTGHSLGGALATLLALELSSSQLAK